jgi:outer membrane protein insertion porin family
MAAVVYWYIRLIFNNFQQETFKRAYKPLPMGDGQKYLYVYKQPFQTYSVSFSEPWFGQKTSTI